MQLALPECHPPPAAPASAVFRDGIFTGKAVLITGGGSGIGLHMAEGFARQGARVAVCGRTESKLLAAVEQIGRAATEAGLAAEALPVQCDVRSAEACVSAVAAVERKWGRLDVLVNGAAGNFMSLAEDLSPNAFATVVDIDLKGCFNMSRAAFPLLKKTGPGAVVINLSHPQAHHAVPFQAHAISAKAGIDRLTDTLGVEWAEYGIRVVGISPGPVSGTEGGPTGRVFGMMGQAGKGKKKPDPAAVAKAEKQEKMRLLSTCPLGRYGERDDCTNAALFLASPAASWCTAVTLPVDGGYRHQAGTWFAIKPFIRMGQKMQKSAQKKAKKPAPAKL